MADCVCLTTCSFFNDKMANMPLTSEWMKTQFCLADNSQCARYLIFSKLGKDRVPKDLYPHNIERAQQILSADV
jgi:hypothetical protein